MRMLHCAQRPTSARLVSAARPLTAQMNPSVGGGAPQSTSGLQIATMAEPVRVMITGAAGQIGYALAPMVARGAMLGPDTPVILHLLDIPPAEEALKGVVMELVDAAYPLLKVSA